MNVLVTGGGTIAPIDDVRTITNRLFRPIRRLDRRGLPVARRRQVWHVHAPTAQLPLFARPRFDLETAGARAELDRLDRLHDDWKAVRGRLHLVPLRTGDSRGLRRDAASSADDPVD